MFSKTIVRACWLVLLVCVSVSASQAAGEDVLGVFGFPQATPETAIAIWAPLDDGESVYGIRWYHNDGNSAFPFLYAVAGDPEHPEVLATATVIGESLSGESGSWSEYFFSQPLSSSSSGLYFLFQFPDGSNYEFPGEYGGAGMGYISGDGIQRCWFSGDGDNWNLINPEGQIAGIPLVNTNKSGNVLVLNKPGEHQDTHQELPINIGPATSISSYPNPFNPSTNISFSLPHDAQVKLAVFDLRGHLVRDLINEVRLAGKHEIMWNGRGQNGNIMPSGVYFAQLKYGGNMVSTRLTMLQ